jgi:heme/copper-type cytochrome/quinol oxidase subunit 3
VFLSARGQQPAVFHHGAQALSKHGGEGAAVLLLGSSWFVAAAARAQVRARWLAGALACGLGYAVLTVTFYGHLLAVGLGPGRSAFWMDCFVLEGVQLVHLLIGLVALAFAMSTRRAAVLPVVAAYWHVIVLAGLLTAGLVHA